MRNLIILLIIIICSTSNALALSASEKTSIRRAFELASQNKWDDAFSSAEASGNRLAVKVLTWHYMTKSGNEHSFDEISSFIKNNPDWPQQKVLKLRAEQALAREKAASKAASWFSENDPQTGEGMLIYALALMESNTEKARHLAKEGFATANLSSENTDYYISQLSSILTREDYGKRVSKLLCEEKTSEASRLINSAPENVQDLFKVRLAVISGSSSASSLVDRLAASQQKDAGLTFDRIKYRDEKGDESGVRELLANLDSSGCDPDVVWPFRREHGLELMRRKNYKKAFQIISKHGLAEGEEFARAEFLAGWIATTFLKDARTGYEHFYKLYQGVNYPVSISRAAYWAGIAAKTNGNADIARNWFDQAAKYPTTFFGQLAQKELGGKIHITGDVSHEPTESEWAEFKKREAVRAAMMLAESDNENLAKFFIYEIQNQSKNASVQIMAARIGKEVSSPDLVVKGAKNAHRNGFLLLKEGYPTVKFEDNGVERALVLSIIRQESEFDPKAVSKSGAVGLMQLMPKTAAHVAKKNGLDYSPGSLMKASYNITLGSEYIGELLRKFDGSLPLAIAAYNAGPGRVVEWNERFGDPRRKEISELNWMEFIPFEETRNYVMRVMENIEVYRSILGTQKQSYSTENTADNSAAVLSVSPSVTNPPPFPNMVPAQTWQP